MRRIVQGLILFAFLVLFAAVACVAVIFITTGNDPLTAARNGIAGLRVSLMQDELNTPAGNSAEPVRFVVVPGMSTGQIAEGLSVNGLITDPNLFVTYAVAERLTSELEAGTYFLSNNMPITEIATRLTDSNSSRLDLRVWEGWRIEEIAEAIDGNQQIYLHRRGLPPNCRPKRRYSARLRRLCRLTGRRIVGGIPVSR